MTPALFLLNVQMEALFYAVFYSLSLNCLTGLCDTVPKVFELINTLSFNLMGTVTMVAVLVLYKNKINIGRTNIQGCQGGAQPCAPAFRGPQTKNLENYE